MLTRIRSMSLWSIIVLTITYLFNGFVFLLGVYAVNFFIALPIIHGELPKVDQVVFALGILSIGMIQLAWIRVRTKSLMWLSFANVSFWFLLYNIVLDASSSEGFSPSLHSILHGIFMLSLTVVFLYLVIVNRNREKASGASTNEG